MGRRAPRGAGAWDLPSGLGEKVCGSDSPVGTSPVELPRAVQPSKASLSGRCLGVSVPTAGGVCWGGALLCPPPTLKTMQRQPLLPALASVSSSV